MATFIVSAIVLGGLALAARSVFKSKKAGNSCGSCTACEKSKSGGCH